MGDIMFKSNENKVLYILLITFTFFVVIISGNVAVPIIYQYFMKVIGLLSPFIIGFFVAFLLHTLVDRIEEQGINRMLAVFLVFLIFIIIMVYVIASLIPIVTSQFIDFERQIPQIYQSLSSFFDNLWYNLDFIPEKYRFGLDDVGNWIFKYVFRIRFNSSNLANILASFNLLVLTPIISYYFLYDYNNIKDKLKSYLLKHKLKFIYYFLREADEGVGAYFRGLILVMNLMAMAAGLGFYFVGLDYPLLFGFIVGYTNAIPIIGNYIGGIPAIFFALTKSFELALLSLVVIVIVQLIESNIVTPYIQSKSIDSHPLLILLAFIIFGRYFGFLGMVFAIPLLAIFLLIIKYIRIYFRLKRCQNKNKKLNKVS